MSAGDLTAAGRVDVDSWLVGACRDLGLSISGLADDLFEVGGTSLTVVKLVARAEEQFGENALTPDDVFERSTVGEIAASIRNNRPRP